MNHTRKIVRSPSSSKRATNLSLSADLIADAKALDINISQACEAGLEARIREKRSEQWKSENREAIESWNDYVRENGLPYDEYRQS